LKTIESTLCEVRISSSARVDPQVKFSSPIEGMDPPLPPGVIELLIIVD